MLIKLGNMPRISMVERMVLRPRKRKRDSAYIPSVTINVEKIIVKKAIFNVFIYHLPYIKDGLLNSSP
ncbi:hypothetical protein D3C74_487850 [compost metagenome]